MTDQFGSEGRVIPEDQVEPGLKPYDDYSELQDAQTAASEQKVVDKQVEGFVAGVDARTVTPHVDPVSGKLKAPPPPPGQEPDSELIR